MGTGVRQRKHYGPRGEGEIRIMKSGEARCYLDIDGYREVFQIAAEDVPSEVGSWEFGPIKKVVVELTEDETEIRNIRPANGTFYLVFDRFAAREDPERRGKYLPPTIKHKEAQKVTLPDGRSWTNPPHERFFAILRVVGGTQYDGMEFVKPLVYQFEESISEPGQMEIVYDRKHWYNELVNFLTIAGFDFDADTLTRSENVLPQLQEVLKDRDVVFQGVVNNGWLDRKLENIPEGTTVKR